MTARETTARRPLAFRYRESIVMIDANAITFSPGDWSGRGRKITWPRETVNIARAEPIDGKPGLSRFIFKLRDETAVVVIARGTDSRGQFAVRFKTRGSIGRHRRFMR
jgi:hypothetical protein